MRGYLHSGCVILLGILVLGMGFLTLGAFPPDPRTQSIQKTLPGEAAST